MVGQPLQLRLDQGNEFFQRLLVPLAPIAQ
jgi:hypothetical protein